MTFTNCLKSGIAVCALLLASQSAFAVENAGSIHGVVKDASGKAVGGAFVKVRSADTHWTFLAISKDGGAFEAKDLPAGSYTIEGVGGGFETKSPAPITVASGKAADASLALTTKQGPMLPAAWPRKIPDELAPKPDQVKLPEGKGKELVQEKCTVCHDMVRIVISRTDKDDWAHTVGSMRGNMLTSKLPDLTDEEAATIVDYLAANFRPDIPYNSNNRLPRKFLQGNARDYRVVTYRMDPNYSEPHDIAVDPTGIAWAAKRGGTASVGGKLVRFDPHALTVSEVDAPPGSAPNGGRRIGNPQINGQGMLWSADAPNGRWLSFDTKTEKFLAHYPPKGQPAGGNSMALNLQNGTIWASDPRGGAYTLDPKTDQWRSFRSPTARSGAYGIAIAGDNTVYYAEDAIDKIGHVDPATGKVEELAIPVKSDMPIFPRRMNTDAEGNIWVGLWGAGKLMKIDYKTKQMTVYDPPTKSAGNYSVVVDKKRNIIWVSEQKVDKIARFDPSNNSWMEFSVPDSQSDTRRIEIDPTDNDRIFFSGNSANLIGFLEYKPGKL